MKTSIRDIFVKFILLITLSVTFPTFGADDRNIDNYQADFLIQWNKKILELATEEDGLLTLKGVRTEALMHLAIHNSLNAIQPVYEQYLYEGRNPNADPIAASVQAAYDIAVNQFPDKQSELEKELEKWLSVVVAGEAKKEGIMLGHAVASTLLKARADDNWNGEGEYKWQALAPGVYAEFNEHSGTPKGFVFGAGWAKAKPFMLSSNGQFRSPPPPEINSEAYTKAYNEVKEFGELKSKVRTKDQAHLAMWWKDFIESSGNRLARKLVVKENLDLWQAARLFALMNMSVYDAYISVFDNKFHYNHWRPYTAIRWAASDGNAHTEPDTVWNNLHQHTYPFPSYPSAHGAASGAAMTVLAHALGTGDSYPFTMNTETVDKGGPFSGKIKMEPPTRSFSSFSEAAREAALSRVYLGIHFRYDSEVGYNLGRNVGEYATQNFLTALN